MNVKPESNEETILLAASRGTLSRSKDNTGHFQFRIDNRLCRRKTCLSLMSRGLLEAKTNGHAFSHFQSVLITVKGREVLRKRIDGFNPK